MFIIIGGDGKEYGPATADQVRAWITAGRANLDTKAKALGTEEWRRLGDFAEFGSPDAPPPAAPAAPLMPPLPGEPAPMPSLPSSYPSAPAAEPVLADQGMRLVARLIDWVLGFVVIIPGMVVFGSEIIRIAIAAGQGQQPDLGDMEPQRLILGGLLFGAGWLLLLVVQVWLLATRGQSIGKRIVGVRIVKFADNSPAGIVHAWLLREALITVISIVVSMVPFFIGPLLLQPAFHLTDWCFIFRSDRRCLHDLIAGTKVVKA